MNLLWKYLIESGLSLCLFYGIYWAFLRRDTFFARNRFYLALTIILSMIIPLVSISIRQPSPIYTFEALLDEAVIIPATSLSSHSGFSIQSILSWFYWFGVGFFLLKFLFHAGQIYWLTRRYGITIENGTRIVYMDRNISPFSFYNIIFLNESLSKSEFREKIIAHEKNHIRNRHTLDLIIFETLTIIQWFNPIAWLYKWSLKEVHEFQADDAVIREGHDSLNYQELIISQVFGNQFFRIAHNLNKSLLKKRIIMMTKFKSSKISRYKIILAIPAALLIISLFSFSGGQPDLSQILNSPSIPIGVVENQDTAVYFTVDTMPKFQGGDVLKFRKYLAMNLAYPKEAREKDISGKVFVQFVVNVKGKVERIVVVRGVHPLLDKEAVRVITGSPDWEPGIKDGKKVNVAYTFPVSFVLGEKKSQPDLEIPTVDPNNPDVYFIVEEMPIFQGGDAGDFRNYVAKNLKYPKEALEKGISGKVFVQFLVNERGAIENVKVVRGVDPLLDKEAVRVVSESPLWKPGKQDGKTVKVAYTFPIAFALKENMDSKNQEQDVSEVKGELFFVVEQMPKFQGSDDFTKFREYVASNLIYPEEAVKEGIEGKVFIQFVVDVDGEVKDAKILRSANPIIDKEALRTVSFSPTWEPGLQRGVKVPVQFTMPVVFKLSEKPLLNPQDETVVVGFKSEISDDALYFVDGEAASLDKVKSLNPDDIESIEVIKGEKAEEAYGSEGKNGVIQVFTKSDRDMDININLRDVGKNSDLLMFIDGQSASKEDLELLNKDEIESITVIKGEEAIEKYGKKAKEGVIIITMK